VGLVLLAWIALWAWGQSPYARFLGHEELGEVDIGVSGDSATVALAFVGGWTLMTFAMMLPTSLPLISMFQTVTGRREDRRLLVALLVLGYVIVWAAFGVVAHAGDLGLHRLVEQSAWLEDNAWAIGGATFVLAGVYQFTPLKYHCLDKCRSPLGFITEHWSGSGERAAAFRLGLHHGLFCVGCCWSLMLLMFAVGTGNLGWMLALGTVMAVEKNMPWGRQLSAPLGIGLVALGLVVIALGSPVACAC
jgi:predicted metal-binding membrane protein